MYQIKTLNKISPHGLDVFNRNKYLCGDDVDQPDGVLVRSASMHELEFPQTLRAIARAGAGVNNIPIDRCSEQGIVVFNTPGANANAVKELVICGLLISARKVYPAMEWVQTLKGEGDAVPKLVEQGKSRFSGPELIGKKLGVVGLGAIGVKVANFARHFGMQVYGYDPYMSVDTAWSISRDIKHAASLKEIYENCDFISLHVPMTQDTKGMINSESIQMMKHGVRLLNFARAELVVTEDLMEGLEEKQIGCAGDPASGRFHPRKRGQLRADGCGTAGRLPRKRQHHQFGQPARGLNAEKRGDAGYGDPPEYPLDADPDCEHHFGMRGQYRKPDQQIQKRLRVYDGRRGRPDQ